jgi:predicted transcriptional regulator
MKKYSFFLALIFAGLVLHAQNGGLKVGDKATDWKFTDADKVEHSMETWAGKVLQINYVDPDESDLNDPFNDAIDKAVDVDKIISKDDFKGFGIVDCKSTWKPNGLIRLIARKKAEKYETTILFDYDAVLQNQWGLPSDSYTVIIVDKNRVVRALYKGKVPDSEIPGVIELIIKLTKE